MHSLSISSASVVVYAPTEEECLREARRLLASGRYEQPEVLRALALVSRPEPLYGTPESDIETEPYEWFVVLHKTKGKISP